MRELSLHIMDIVENGLRAGATLVEIFVKEDRKGNWLSVEISDNGHGMPDETLKRVMDPFFSTRSTRRVGLGLPMFRELCRRCDGEFDIRSKDGEGTKINASFRIDHIDLIPLGDMAGSMMSLIMGNPEADFLYTHEVDDRTFHLDTRQVREELEGLEIYNPQVVKSLGKLVRESLADLMEE